MTRSNTLVFSYENFWKIGSVFLLAILTLFLVAYGIRAIQPSDSVSESSEVLLRSEGVRIVGQLETDFISKWQETLTSLCDSLEQVPSDRWEELIENWHQYHPDVFSITAYSVALKWPIHQIDGNFWDYPEVQNLPWDDRQMLFDHLLKNPVNVDPPNLETFWISGILRPDILGYPVITIHFNQEKAVKKLVIQLRLQLFQDLFSSSSLSDLKTCLKTVSGDTLFVSPGFPTQTDTAELSQSKWISEEIEFKQLPWSATVLTQSRKVQKSESWDIQTLVFSGIFALLFATLGSVLLVKWLDRPLKPLYETAQQISRGDFSARIPHSRNQNVHRIGRIINYMAEEMDHIQQMNVSKIIIEKNKTETILKNIADGVLVTDNSDHILVMNPVAEFWFDSRERDVLNVPATDVLKQKRLETLIKDVRTSQKAASIDFHMRILETDEEKIFHAHASPVSNQEDRRIGVVTVIRDVTQQREIEKMKTELVSMVAHELKSPLTSIFGFSELLLKSELPDERSMEYAQVILNESKRLADLVDKFLDLSRLESGKTEPQIRPFNIKESISRLLETHGQLAKSRNIRVITELPGYITNVLGDETMIDQVLLNLYSNAIKYSPEGTKIGIELKENENMVTVSVIDNGMGIEKENLPFIFDKFFRVKLDEDSQRPKGSGLGLSLVKQIIEKHQGTVFVKSQPGVGSVFGFSIQKEKESDRS